MEIVKVSVYIGIICVICVAFIVYVLGVVSIHKHLTETARKQEGLEEAYSKLLNLQKEEIMINFEKTEIIKEALSIISNKHLFNEDKDAAQKLEERYKKLSLKEEKLRQGYKSFFQDVEKLE